MHLRRLSASFVVLATVLIACSPGASPSAPASSPATSPSASSPPAESASPTAEASPTGEASPSETPSGEVTVAIAESELGQILVDREGRTLYAFTNDTAGEPTCAGDCASAWPALTVDGEIVVGEGLDDSDFSTVDSTTGETQVKVGDWPLYYYAQDAAPGDVNGQGVGGKWFVVSPSGELIRE